MLNYSINEIAKIVNGQLFKSENFADTNIQQIITDSRTLFNSENALFFALSGPRNNGHRFIPELLEKKLLFFVVSEKTNIQKNATFILVENTSVAMQKLAAFHRSNFHIPVIGITGSNGKTIVKEWLSEILSQQFSVVKSPKSYNSQIGVPLSVLLMNNYHQLAIFEAGISQPGEMQKLQKIIAPDFGIFTTIGDAHQENFISLQQKINEKLQLFTRTKQLVFCADNELIRDEIHNFCENHRVKTIAWSLLDNTAELYFSAKKENGKTKISAHFNQQNSIFEIPFTDSSSIENVCHCFALTVHLLEKPENILAAFSTLKAVEMRLEIKQGINNCLLINDYYNADLHSLEIALSVLHQQATKNHFKKTLILSDIEQTGVPSEELFKQVSILMGEWKIDKLIGIGKEISKHQELFQVEKEFFPSLAEFQNIYSKHKFRSEAILIKGARFFTFEKIAAWLQEKAHQTVLEIQLNALVHNLNIYRSLLKPETKIMVMVKAFSYGSGDVEIAKLLQYQNVDYLAVAVADEGVQLRNAGVNTPIIVMNPEQSSFSNMIEFGLEPNIYAIQLLLQFLENAKNLGLKNYPVHLKIDTGMNRLGLKTDEEIQQAIELISNHEQLKIESVFSHLAGSDDPMLDDFTNEQVQTFLTKSEKITASFPYKINRHILNSAGI